MGGFGIYCKAGGAFMGLPTGDYCEKYPSSSCWVKFRGLGFWLVFWGLQFRATSFRIEPAQVPLLSGYSKALKREPRGKGKGINSNMTIWCQLGWNLCGSPYCPQANRE